MSSTAPFTPVRVKSPAHQVGAEVQFKNNPGVGFKVIDVVRDREHALKSLDGSGLAIALSHEIEEYCDLEQAAFLKRAKNVMLAKNGMGAKFLDDVTKDLWLAGARFPGPTVTPPALTDNELVAMTAELARMLVEFSGIAVEGLDDTSILRWCSPGFGHHVRSLRCAGGENQRQRALWSSICKIMDLTLGADIERAVAEVYPNLLEEEDF